MSTPEGEYYTEERWRNWIDRLTEEEIDLEDEESGRVLQNFQDDTVIAITKIVADYDDDQLDEDEAMTELAKVREIVLTEPEVADEETGILVGAVQTALVCVFYSAEEYILNGVGELSIDDRLEAALECQDEEDFETALAHCAQAGTRIFDGEEMEPQSPEELGLGPVADWVTGLRSLQSALADPELIESNEE